MAEHTVDSIPDAKLLERAVRGARSPLNGRRVKYPRWAHVADVFALGSTFSAQLCRRFDLKVDVQADAKCWNWRGSKNHRGYGRMNGSGAHRIAHELVNGAIPAGMLVRHRCDNPKCCNPHHLLIGTNKDNTADAIARDRLARGQRHGKAKLLDDQVIYIRQNPEKMTGRALAARFGVTESTISYVRSGRSHMVKH